MVMELKGQLEKNIMDISSLWDGIETYGKRLSRERQLMDEEPMKKNPVGYQ